MKTYYATYLQRNSSNQLRQERKEIQSNNLKDAKITAKRIAEQNDWRLLDVIIGSLAW